MPKLLELRDKISKIPKEQTVVRVSTSFFMNKNGEFVSQRKIKRLKRKSRGFDFLSEDYFNVGDAMLYMFENLHDVKDGIYYLVMSNITRDWESGYVDDYSYRLFPYKEDTNE